MGRRYTRKNKKILIKIVTLIAILIICGIIGYFENKANEVETNSISNNSTSIENSTVTTEGTYSLSNIPPYSGKSYIELNNNMPDFKESDFTTEPFERYSELDSKKRCGVAFANICKEIMPTEERGEITYKPTGWKQNKKGEYDQLVAGGYLYNRCHVIAWRLAGENNNKQNLMTGTRQLNETMIQFENDVANYIKQNKNNHVLYRSIPIFEGDNLLASGIQIESMSVEERENAQDVCFNVYIYNVQPRHLYRL